MPSRKKERFRSASHLRYHWRASLRDSLLLLREFRTPLLLFGAAMVGIGSIYFYASRLLGEPLGSLAESIYLMLTLTFLQPNGAFPTHPFLQIWFFLMPIIGISTLAQ